MALSSIVYRGEDIWLDWRANLLVETRIFRVASHRDVLPLPLQMSLIRRSTPSLSSHDVVDFVKLTLKR